MGYFFLHRSVDGAVGTAEIRWQAMLTLLDCMKLAGWTTRGSGKNGSSGLAFSATPDGVDRWTGQTATQAFDSTNEIWYVLEHPTTAAQTCLTLALVGGGNIVPAVIVAKNRFETAGAWRNAGSVAAGVRPTDVTSTPASEREVKPQNIVNLQNIATFTGGEINRFHSMVRDDGHTGHLIVETSSLGEIAMSWMGFSKLRTPNTGDTNPYVVICGKDLSLLSLWFDSVSPGGCWGLHSDGVHRVHQMLKFKSFGTILQDEPNLDPSLQKKAPILLYSTVLAPDALNTPYIRGVIPDVGRAMAVWNPYDLVDAGTYINLGLFVFPWDGTVLNAGGTNRTSTWLSMEIESNPGGGGGGRTASFNTGAEVL